MPKSMYQFSMCNNVLVSEYEKMHMYKFTCRVIWFKKLSEAKKDKFTNILNICNWFLSKGHVLGPIKGSGCLVVVLFFPQNHRGENNMHGLMICSYWKYNLCVLKTPRIHSG